MFEGITGKTMGIGRKVQGALDSVAKFNMLGLPLGRAALGLLVFQTVKGIDDAYGNKAPAGVVPLGVAAAMSMVPPVRNVIGGGLADLFGIFGLMAAINNATGFGDVISTGVASYLPGSATTVASLPAPAAATSGAPRVSWGTQQGIGSLPSYGTVSARRIGATPQMSALREALNSRT